MKDFNKHLYQHQQQAIIEKNKHDKCLVNMWCGTGKTRTFTISLFQDNQNLNVIVFPSLGLINQYNNDYFLNSNNIFKDNFDNFQCLAFCSDDESKLKCKSSKIKYSTSDNTLKTFIKNKNKKIILVTYQSFEKFINICISNNIRINRLLFDEAHNLVGEKIQQIVFNNNKLDNIVDKTEFYTATPVNRNGITMYDRDEPENSDCGELAFEYLYYQAVEDKICKAFNTEICLYCQKPEYKNKYQPIFELIIRTCLSGLYDYWNILTYHSYVNESDDKSQGISFVKDFASPKNEKLVKTLFTKIQNEEFPNTIELYNVDNVILQGVHSNTKNRQQILDDFDKKQKGRIFILSSCGILNEGIDTKWANMGVPINPSQSIVKESQRIGRLVRIPEVNMPDAVILIPCMIDITQYNKMANDEDKDKMIREQLSESGNFNTVLNVMSAFKYQYDPELYEMCLRYPNMYAPKEIKDNLAKYGLIIKESQGELIDNLKYLCEKEDIPFKIQYNNDMNNNELLELCSKDINKMIEIYTQDYDEPIKFINRECIDEEPIRLFYSDDNKNYSPVIKKSKNKKIKKDGIKSPKKRKPIFNIHTHPDLDVLWQIKDVKLNKIFGKGVLDVSVNYNFEIWEKNLKEVTNFIDKNNEVPSSSSLDPYIKKLGTWIKTQKYNYKKNIGSMKNLKLKKMWENTLEKYYKLQEKEDIWKIRLSQLKEYLDKYNKLPFDEINKDLKYLSFWSSNNIKYCANNECIMKNKEIKDLWVNFEDQYKDIILTYEMEWNTGIKKALSYIDEHKQLPPCENPMGRLYNILKGHFPQTSQHRYNIELKKQILNKCELFYTLNDEILWKTTLQKIIEYIKKNNKLPEYDTDNNIKLRIWFNTQYSNTYYFNFNEDSKISNIIITDWLEFNKNYKNIIPKELYELFLKQKKNELNNPTLNEVWNTNYELVKTYMLENNNQCPITNYKTNDNIKIGSWINDQRQNKKNNKLSQEKIAKLESLTGWFWDKKDMSKQNIQQNKETSNNTKRTQPKSVMSELHKKYKTMNSENLHKHFQENPKDWKDYHKISKENEKSFPTEEIPRNIIIEHLNKLPGKKQKIIADLGCGEGEINDYFKNNTRFKFHNFDHISCKQTIKKQDIKNTELEDYSIDIGILSLAMWGSNCKDYITETYRILDTGGTLLIIEPYKRWCDNEKKENRLVKLLEENKFTIVNISEKKFMFIEARKNN